MLEMNVVNIMRRICEEVESLFDYGFTDVNMRLEVMILTHHMLSVESIYSSAVKATLDSECQLILVLTVSTGMKRHGTTRNVQREREAVFCERLCASGGAPSLVELVACPLFSRSCFGVDAQ